MALNLVRTIIVLASVAAVLVVPTPAAAEHPGDWTDCGTRQVTSRTLVSTERVWARAGSVDCGEANSLADWWFEEHTDDGGPASRGSWECEYLGKPSHYEVWCVDDGGLGVRFETVSFRSVTPALTLADARSRTKEVGRDVFGRGAGYEGRASCRRVSKFRASCVYKSFAGDVEYYARVTIRNGRDYWYWRLRGTTTNGYCKAIGGSNCVRAVRRSGRHTGP